MGHGLGRGGHREEREPERPEPLLTGRTSQRGGGEPRRERERDERGRERQQRVGDRGRGGSARGGDRRNGLARPDDRQVVVVPPAEHPLVRRDEGVAAGLEGSSGAQRERRRGTALDPQRDASAPDEVVELVRGRRVDLRRPHEQRADVAASQPERVGGIRGLRIAPGEELHRAAPRDEELAGDVARESRLVAVADGARADPRDGRHERQANEKESDRSGREADPRAIRRGSEAPPPARRSRPPQERAPARVRPVERGARDERARREPGELDLPADVSQRPLAERAERHRDHRPGEGRPAAEQDRRGEGEAGEEPAHSRKAHQAERKLVRGEGCRAPPAHALRDLAGVEPRRSGERLPPLGTLPLREPPHRAGEGDEAGEHGERRRHQDERLPGLERADGVAERPAGGDPMRLDSREDEPAGVVRAHAGRDGDDRHPCAPGRPGGAELAQRDEGEPDQDHHEPREHVQLGVEVHDHVAGLAALVEELVHGRERLHRPLQRPDRERCTPGEYEPPSRPGGAPDRADDDREQEPEGAEHRDPRAHDQERMQRRRLLRLLRCEAAADDEPSLVEAEVERAAVEREGAGEERPEADVRGTARRPLPAG